MIEEDSSYHMGGSKVSVRGRGTRNQPLFRSGFIPLSKEGVLTSFMIHSMSLVNLLFKKAKLESFSFPGIDY